MKDGDSSAAATHLPGKAAVPAGESAGRPRFDAADILRHLPVVLFGVLFVCATTLRASRQPLRFDEIFTYYVAKLDSASSIVEALLANMDNHPPLDYLLRHFSMALFGPTDFALRFPSVIALLVAALALYVFVLRRTSLVPALLAFAFPFTTQALMFADEGRGYAVLMAGMCLALLGWQLAAERPSAGRLLFLTLALSLGPFSHYYGVLNYVPIAAGEAWRCWERRTVSWPIVACFAVSFASLGALVPFALQAQAYAQWFWTSVSPDKVVVTYYDLFYTAAPGLVGALLGFAVVGLRADRVPAGRQPPTPLPRHEIVAAVLLCLLPFTTFLLAITVTHAYVPKYSLNAVFGVAILGAYAVHRVATRERLMALLMGASIVVWAVVLVGTRGMSAPAAKPVTERLRQFIAESTLPVVMTSYFGFLEFHRYLPPELRRKIYFVSDIELQRAYEGNDTTHRALKNLSRFVPMNVVGLCPFTTEHRSFMIAQFQPYWLTRKLLEDGARLTLEKQDIGAEALLSATLAGPSGC